MPSLKQYLFFGTVLIIIGLYFLVSSDLYGMTELDHLDDRIRFGRLEFYKKVNITVGKIEIHNRQKIFTVNFDGKPVFVGKMEHFLILLQAKGSIKGQGDSFFNIDDQIEKTCKIQRVLSLYHDQEKLTVTLEGAFQDCKDANYKITFQQTADNKLDITVQAPQKYKRAYVLFHHEASNQYYGLGEQFSYLNLGHDRPYSTFVREKGVGRGEQPLTLLANALHGAGGSYFTSYAPSPIWFSSKKTAYVLNSQHYMAWINNKVLIWSNRFTITLIIGESYKDLVKQVSQINGYTPSIPDWVNEGAILGLQGGSQKVLEKYQTLKQQGAQIAGVWIQDWVSKRQSLGYSRLWWNWELDKQHYKNWDDFAQQLKADGIEILIYINPMLADASQKPNANQNYYKIAQEKDHFVKLKNGETFKTRAVSDFEASLIDFKNEKAVSFLKDLIKNALDETGAKGMMVDFSQAFPAQETADSIEQGAILHNQYPNLYLEKVHSIIDEIRGKQNDFYTFSRAGHLNSPKYTKSLWAGDQAMNFNFHTGLPSCLTAILSSGLVGYSNTHCDIGGYYHIKNDIISFTYRSQILLLRWMQLSAFTAVFRTHEGNSPDSTLQVYSNRFLARSFAFYSRVYAALTVYRKEHAKVSAEQGLPLVRAVFLELNGINETQHIQDQFFLGSEIYVAPYLNEDTERKFFLPKGEWKLLWNGQIYKGCDCQRVWKDILPAVFVRTSSPHCDQIIAEIASLIKQYRDVLSQLPRQNQEQL